MSEFVLIFAVSFLVLAALLAFIFVFAEIGQVIERRYGRVAGWIASLAFAAAIVAACITYVRA